jgi:acyl-CoA thioesterase
MFKDFNFVQPSKHASGKWVTTSGIFIVSINWSKMLSSPSTTW